MMDLDLNLNVGQTKAITCPLNPTIVVAGPGSGKTYVIIHRVYYMISELGCNPQNILVVTFSKLAAREMQERFEHQFQGMPVIFGTLHSIFYRILRKADPDRYHLNNLLGENEKKAVLQNLFIKLEADEYEDFIDEFIKHLTLMKNQLINPKHYYPDGISKEIFLKLVHEYEYYKEINHKFDFDDMLVDCYYLLKNDSELLNAVRNHYQYILVDEFQDINLVQFEIIKMMAGENKNIFVVGDDDQSIYKFRGAKPEFLLDFKNHFPGTQEIFLDVNYRSTKNILNYSIALITNNKNRYHKELTTPNASGSIPKMIHCKDSKEQASLILNEIIRLKNQSESLGNIAVIYRTNIEARSIVEILIDAHMPFCIRDNIISLYDQWITKDLLCYLSLAGNMDNHALALQIINKPKRYISKAALQSISPHGNHLFSQLLLSGLLSEWQKNYIQQLLFDLQIIKEKSLQEAIRYIRKNVGYDRYVQDYCDYRKIPSATLFEVLDEIEDSAAAFKEAKDWEAFLKDVSKKIKEQASGRAVLKEAVTLTTMHGSKGLEFNHVFIINVVEGTIPYHKSNTETELEEERRLLYVAITRAKKHLTLFMPSEKYGKPVSSSSFAEQLVAQYLLLQIKINHSIFHKKFGKGKIIDVVDNNILIVQFNDTTTRKIDGNYCLNNGIIYWEE